MQKSSARIAADFRVGLMEGHWPTMDFFLPACQGEARRIIEQKAN
jgi:hypothetical protein